MKRSLFTLFILALVCLTLAPADAAAQNPPGLVIDPNWVEFDPGTDHASIHHYELGWFLLGATDPVQSADIGTAAAVLGKVKLALPQSYPVGKVYVARVRGVTLDGTVTLTAQWSDISNPFGKGPAKILGNPAVTK